MPNVGGNLENGFTVSDFSCIFKRMNLKTCFTP